MESALRNTSHRLVEQRVFGRLASLDLIPVPNHVLVLPVISRERDEVVVVGVRAEGLVDNGVSSFCNLSACAALFVISAARIAS